MKGITNCSIYMDDVMQAVTGAYIIHYWKVLTQGSTVGSDHALTVNVSLSALKIVYFFSIAVTYVLLTFLLTGLEPLEVYFINDTPRLSVGNVFAEFETNRPGVEIQCHLTRLDSALQDCKLHAS